MGMIFAALRTSHWGGGGGGITRCAWPHHTTPYSWPGHFCLHTITRRWPIHVSELCILLPAGGRKLRCLPVPASTCTFPPRRGSHTIFCMDFVSDVWYHFCSVCSHHTPCLSAAALPAASWPVAAPSASFCLKLSREGRPGCTAHYPVVDHSGTYAGGARAVLSCQPCLPPPFPQPWTLLDLGIAFIPFHACCCRAHALHLTTTPTPHTTTHTTPHHTLPLAHTPHTPPPTHTHHTHTYPRLPAPCHPPYLTCPTPPTFPAARFTERAGTALRRATHTAPAHALPCC